MTKNITGKKCEIHTMRFCSTKFIVYPYDVDTISIAWKYTIIMDNQNPFYKGPYNFHSMDFQIFFQCIRRNMHAVPGTWVVVEVTVSQSRLSMLPPGPS
jgi:hypothetical protein